MLDGLGAAEVVFANGTASGAQLFAGGVQVVYGAAIGTILSGGGGFQRVYSGGESSNTRVTQGSSETVKWGGSAFDTTAVNGGILVVEKGATSIDAAVYGEESTGIGTNSFEHVFGTASGTTVGLLGAETVEAGGVAIGTTIYGGLPPPGQTMGVAGEQVVYGTASGARLVGADAIQYVQSGGSAGATTVDSGGFEFVHNGGFASGTTVSNGGHEFVKFGGTAEGTSLTSGGYAVVAPDGAASDVVVGTGGYLTAVSGGSLTGVTISGAGVVALFAGAIVTTPISFVSSGGTVKWGGSGLLGAELSGFVPGDKLDLVAMPWAPDGSAAMQGTLLTVSAGGQVDQIQFTDDTNFSGTAWQVFAGGQQGIGLKLVHAPINQDGTV